MKHIPLYTLLSTLYTLPLLAAVPLSWTVETSRVQPATFEAYQGETLTFEAHLQANGKPLEAPLNYSFFWQTNGMGSTYWEAPCNRTIEQSEQSNNPTNALFATWSPSMDVGARVYNCFIGSPSNNYHAAFQLRLRPSPGATPNTLPLPTPVIDFAKVRVLNPPWEGGVAVETDPTVPSWAKQPDPPVTPSSENEGWAVNAEWANGSSYAEIADWAENSVNAQVADWSDNSNKALDVDPNAPGLSGKADKSSVDQLAGQVQTIGAHLNAEDARFVSTNYNSQVHMPEAYVEVKLPDESWAVIWKEMTRWNWFFDSWVPANLYNRQQIDDLLDGKADRSWGFYDSHTGDYAPDGYTWISSPKVAIAAGLSYQRTIVTEGAVWVLESNGLVTETGGVSSNGYFRILDGEGNVQFEIVKGDKRTIGADADSCEVVGAFVPTKLRIGYSIVSDAHPTLEICNDLNTQDWKREDDEDCLATVTWEGQSGAWVAYVQGKAAESALFVMATYELGGETYIRNVAPVSMEYIYVGGVKYSVGTATISGHTVLTLTPAN